MVWKLREQKMEKCVTSALGCHSPSGQKLVLTEQVCTADALMSKQGTE